MIHLTKHTDLISLIGVKVTNGIYRKYIKRFNKKLLFLSDWTHTVAVKYEIAVQFKVFVKQNAWMIPKL